MIEPNLCEKYEKCNYLHLEFNRSETEAKQCLIAMSYGVSDGKSDKECYVVCAGLESKLLNGIRKIVRRITGRIG